jgi:hypothetical protein
MRAVSLDWTFYSIHRENHPRHCCPHSYTNWKLPFLLNFSYLMSSDLSLKMVRIQLSVIFAASLIEFNSRNGSKRILRRQFGDETSPSQVRISFSCFDFPLSESEIVVMGSWKTASPIAFAIEMAPPFYVSIAECLHFQLGLPRLLLPQNVLADQPQRRPLRRHGRVLFLVTIATFTGTWIASILHYQRCPFSTRNGCVPTTRNEC